MPRTTTSAFNTKLALTVTSVGYLVQITYYDIYGPDPEVPTIARYCDLGTVTYASQLWTEQDMEVSGFSLTLDGMSSEPMTLKIFSTDLTLAKALMQAGSTHEAPVTIYQIARGAVATGDAPVLANMVVDSMEVNIDSFQLRLLPIASRYAFAPNKRISASHGLANAVAPGTMIPWGYGYYVVERR